MNTPQYHRKSLKARSKIMRTTKYVQSQLTLPGKVLGVTATAKPNLNRFDATVGPLVANLPPCSSVQGATVIVQKIDAVANTVTITPNGADTIDGAATLVL